MYWRFKVWLHTKLNGHVPTYMVTRGGLFNEPYVYCTTCSEHRNQVSKAREQQLRQKIKEAK